MKSKLSSAELEKFNVLALSMSASDLAREFEMSLSTVRRYKFPKERALSRNVVRKHYHKSEKICAECGMNLKNHPRCSACEILTHDEGEMCLECAERRKEIICIDNAFIYTFYT